MSEFDRKIITETITRMLARREHSFKEIAQKLAQKGIESEAFYPILEEFKAADIQSDYRYAESRARALALKGSGPQKVRADLLQKGVNEINVERAMADIDVDWFELALRVKQKKFGEEKEQDYKKLLKQKQFLLYRGFSNDQIGYAVKGE